MEPTRVASLPGFPGPSNDIGVHAFVGLELRPIGACLVALLEGAHANAEEYAPVFDLGPGDERLVALRPEPLGEGAGQVGLVVADDLQRVFALFAARCARCGAAVGQGLRDQWVGLGNPGQLTARRWAYGGIGIILVMAVVSSLSRGGFLGLAAMFAYCFMVSKHKVRNLIVMSIAGAALLLFAPSEAIDEIVSIRAEAKGEVEFGTGNARLFLWETATNMWKDHPVLGVGGGNFNFLAGEYQPDWEGGDYSERDWSGTTTHSLYFQILSELGAAGLVILGAIVASHFVLLRQVRILARKSKRLPQLLRAEIEMYSGVLGGAMVGYLASGAFLSVGYYPYLFYFSGLGVAFGAIVQKEMQRLESARSPTEWPAGSTIQGPLETSADEGSASLGQGLTATRRTHLRG